MALTAVNSKESWFNQKITLAGIEVKKGYVTLTAVVCLTLASCGAVVVANSSRGGGEKGGSVPAAAPAMPSEAQLPPQGGLIGMMQENAGKTATAEAKTTNTPAPTATTSPTATLRPIDAPKPTDTPTLTSTPDKKVWTHEDIVDKEGNLKIEAILNYLKESGFEKMGEPVVRKGVITGTETLTMVGVSSDKDAYHIDSYDRAGELAANALRKMSLDPTFAGIKDRHGNSILDIRQVFQVSGPTPKDIVFALQKLGVTGFEQDSDVGIYVVKVGKTLVYINSGWDNNKGMPKQKMTEGMPMTYFHLVWSAVANLPNARSVVLELGLSSYTQASGENAMKIEGPKYGYK